MFFSEFLAHTPRAQYIMISMVYKMVTQNMLRTYEEKIWFLTVL